MLHNFIFTDHIDACQTAGVAGVTADTCAFTLVDNAYAGDISL